MKRIGKKLSGEIAALRVAYAPAYGGDHASLEAMTGDKFILHVLSDTQASAHVLARAIWVAPRIATEEIIRALLMLIKNPDVAGLAADALISVDDYDTSETLEGFLLDESLPIASRAAAAEALGWLSRVESAQAVKSLLRAGPGDPELAQALIDAVGLVQLRENRQDCALDIARFLDSPVADVRATALRVLANMRAREVADQMASLIGDQERTSTGATVGEKAQTALQVLRRAGQK